MSFKVKILETGDDNWNEHLRKYEYSSAFQTMNWIKNYKNPGSTPIFIQVENDNEIVGQLAAIIHKNFLRNENTLAKKIGSKINISSILTWTYGPIIFDEGNYSIIIKKILQCIDQIAKDKNIVMITGSTPPMEEYNPEEIFKEFGYNKKIWSTYVISLKENEDELFESFDKKTRYDIRKAYEKNLSFEIPDEQDYPVEFYKLKNEEYVRAHRHISPISESYEERWKNLYKNEIEKIFLAKKNNKVVSGISNIFFNGYVIQHGVANSSDRDSFGGTFLTWETIKWAIKNKQKFYDMGGINPNPGSKKEKNIDFYKAKWGGRLYNYSIYTKIVNKQKHMVSSVLKNPKNILKKIEKL